MRRIIVLALFLAIGFWGVWPAVSGWQIQSALKDGNAAALSSKIDLDSVRASLKPAVGSEVGKRLDEALAKAGPGGLVLGGDLKKQLVPQIADRAVATIVTAENMIRIYRDGGAIKDSVAKIIGEQMGNAGGLGALGGAGSAGGAGLGDLAKGLGGAAGGLDKLGGAGGLGGLLGGGRKSPVTDITGRDDTASAAKPDTKETAKPDAKAPPEGFGLGNIKSFGLSGPLGVYVGVAKDSAAKEPDLTAEMSFTGFDWKLTGLRPKL